MQVLAETKLFDFDLVLKQIPDLLKYLPVTLELAALSMCIGMVLGLLLAVIRLKKIPVLRQLAAFYISLIRGTPAIVQLYIAYFGIPMFLKYMNLNHGTDFDISAFPGFACAVFAMGFNESAYNAETIRAALSSVDRGQIEAASAIGMTYPQALRRVILPEAMTVALPGLGNAFIGLIKGTSLAFTCAVVEMTAQGKILGGIFPVISYRNACFLNNEVAGIKLDQTLIDRYAGKNRDEGEALAEEISLEIARTIAPFVDGFYLMTPFQRTELMGRIIRGIRDFQL